MRRSQELTIKMSEARERLNKTIEKRNGIPDGEQPSAELTAEMDSATKAIHPLEVEYRAAVTSEAAEDEAAKGEDRNGEQREIDALEARCSVTAFMAEAVTDKRVMGAELEYRQATLGEGAEPGMMPVRLLGDMVLPDDEEHRAVTPVAAGAKGLGSQADILARVFERSIAASLGVSMPTVPMGVRTYPVMTSGTDVSMKQPSAEQAATAGSFTGHEISPARLTGSFEFRVEDLQLLRGLEDALRRDLRASIQDHMDDQIVNGNGSSPNVSGFLDELTAPTAEGARATFASYVKAFTGEVDGINAYDIAELRGVISTSTYADMEAMYRANNTEHTGYSELRRRGVGLRVSDRMPNTPASGTLNKNDTIIIAKTGYPGMNAVAPIWEGVHMIRDPYTLATKGEVRITMLMLWNFQILREAGWKLVARQVVA